MNTPPQNGLFSCVKTGVGIGLVSLIFLSTYARAQSFSQRTNDVVIDLKKPAFNTTYPTLTWVSPRLEYTNTQLYSLQIEAHVLGDVDLKEITLHVTNAEKEERIKRLDVANNSITAIIKQNITLQDGQNTIEIVVENVKGGKISSTRTVLVGKDAIADAISADRKDYAILFATDKYDYWTDLVNPVEDAHAIADELEKNYGFTTEVIENPSQEDVFIKIADYVQRKFKPQDQLMIFFAGHGYFDDSFGEGFIVAKNSLENDKAKTSYIAHSRLRSVINNIPCEHIFLSMDVCFGGTFDPLVAKGRGGPPNAYQETSEIEFLVRKLSYKTRKYLTSGGKTYVSDGIPGKHSPFALKFLQALKDSGGLDHILTLEELKSYVEKLIPEPRFGSFGDDNPSSDFVFVSKRN